jgi:acetylornithine deacetylase/succinyl-diaminopimelate desuccinylase-like protein
VPTFEQMSHSNKSLRSLIFVLGISLSWTQVHGQQLSEQQAAIVRFINEEKAKILKLRLQELADISHPLGADGCREPCSFPRCRAQRQSRKRVVLIGQMDTVFEPSSPFQEFVRDGDTAIGSGTGDTKGGIVIILSALRLSEGQALNDANITVFLTGDEEYVGEPVEVARKELVAVAKNSDAVLSFEPEIALVFRELQ